MFEHLLEAPKAKGIEKFATGIIFPKEDKILLVRRVPDDFLGGYWEPPGGGMDEGESLEESTLREAEEETGLTITRLEHLKNADIRYKFQGHGTWVYQFNFIASKWHGELTLNPQEHDKHAWVKKGDTPEFLGCTPNMQGVIKNYWNHKGKN